MDRPLHIQTYLSLFSLFISPTAADLVLSLTCELKLFVSHWSIIYMFIVCFFISYKDIVNTETKTFGINSILPSRKHVNITE